jgi:replicative DNA helicase Mcm
MSTQPQELVTNLESFLRWYYKEELLELASRYPSEQSHLEIDWRDIYQFDRDIGDDLLEQPGKMFDYIREAVRVYDLPIDKELTDVTILVQNLPDSRRFNVGEPRAAHREQLLAVCGQITKTTKVKPKLEEAAFECQRCGTLTYIPQKNGFQEPHECQGCERQGPWTINNDQSQFRDFQLARVQEPPEEAKGGDGRFIDVHLEDELVESVQPGDRVAAIAQLKFTEPNKNSQVFDSHLYGRGIEVQETDFEEIDVDEHMDAIEEIAEHRDPVELISKSIAPKIIGADRLKEAVTLQLFSGRRVEYPDGMIDRGNIHILLLGDPGTAKSRMLNAVSRIAPRSVKSSGKGASKAGMTAAAVRDDFGETEWTLEAGAMVVANKGVACVDEIDKVPEEVVSSLHGALEDEVVHINKAGINATLPAQTSMLAAGNPKYGRFDPLEPVADQIDLDPPLMSRFDLMFMVTDDIEENEERKVTEHIIESRRSPEKREPEIPREVLRAYIAHAKQSVKPRIESNDVVARLTDFFTQLRLSNQGDDMDAGPVPVTRRKLEGIQRLAEASARARLSESVEKKDVERAISLVTYSMRQVGVDAEKGQFDVDIIETGSSNSQKQRMKTIRSLIKELETTEDGAPLGELEDAAEAEDIPPGKLQHSLQKLKNQGEVWEPKTDHYRVA